MPSLTAHPTFLRHMGPGTALQPCHVEPARLVAGSRHGPPHKCSVLRSSGLQPTDSHAFQPLQNLALLDAPNFLMLSRQKGVQVLRITWGALEEATKERVPLSPADLPDDTFRKILRGEGNLLAHKAMFPEPLHDFLVACLDPTSSQSCVLRRISEEDATSFFAKADKPPACHRTRLCW
jgi:hypothetical protein